MKKFVISVAVFSFAWIFVSPASSALPVVWEQRLDRPGWSFPSVQLTPNGSNLVVSQYSNAAFYGTQTYVQELAASSGSIAWTQTAALPGNASTTTWVDNQGNIYLMSDWGGHTIAKFGANLAPIWSYSNGAASFEGVMNAITDSSGNVYAQGYGPSGSGQGTMLVKLNSSGSAVWTSTVQHTSGKDDYSTAMTMVSNGNIYTAGCDYGNGNSSQQGRILGHSAADGSVFLDMPVPQPDSIVFGLASDSQNNLYAAYAYNEFTSSGQRTGQEQVVVDKLDQQGNVIWQYPFNIPGMYAGYNTKNGLILAGANEFYVDFNERENGTEEPGIAAFDTSGDLLWMDTIDRPGWEVSGSLQVANGTIYMGLYNPNDYSQADVIAVTPAPEPSTLVLLSVGGISLAAYTWRRKRRAA